MTTKVKLIADGAVTSAAIGNNPTFIGTEGVVLPSGTTAERPGSPADGVFRFNTTTDIMEYYNGANWQGVVQGAPTVTSISPTTALNANQTITVTGTGFNSGAHVQFIGNDGTKYDSPSTIFNSITQLTATTPSTALTVANEPYDIKVINASGFSGTLDNVLDAGSTPAFGVASGSLGTVPEGGNASGFTQITATDADSQSLTISLKSGSSLPSGVSLSSSGVFSGTLPVTGSAVTTSFTVQASDGTNIAERNYTITSRVYVYAQLSGSGTWSVPAGVDTAEVLIVAGGASGTKSQNVGSGGGGAGGIVYKSSYTFTSTDKSSGIAYSVGAGGNGVGSSTHSLPYDGGFNNGENTTFAISGGTITAKGGGGGGGYGGNSPHYGGNSVTPGFSQSYFAAAAGGSGGGGAWNDLTGASSNQGTFSGWTSYGNAGGTFNTAGSGGYSGAGGGGAGGAGNGSTRNTAGAGGVGQEFSNFSSYGDSGWFGGGGAGGQVGGTRAAGGQGGGGQGANGSSGINYYSGEDATDTTGGGGGGAGVNGSYGNYTNKGGDGGNGTILIRY